MTCEDELKALRAAVRHAAHELSVWAADVLDDGAGSREDLTARLSVVAKSLMDALERRPDDTVDLAALEPPSTDVDVR